MSEKWKFYRFRDRLKLLAMVFVCFSFQCSNFCWSLNDEGLALLKFKERIISDPLNSLSDWRENLGELDSCSWYGVECSDGKVIILNLKDLCLGGTLAPELGQLVHIKSIVLRNNSLTGVIPEEISQLKELEILDLGYNDFTGPVPSKLGNNLSLTILLLDNNGVLGTLSPKLHELTMVSEFLIDEGQLSGAAKKTSCKQRPNSWHEAEEDEDSGNRRMLQNIPRRGEALQSPPTPSVIPETNSSVSNGPPVPSSSGSAARPSSSETEQPLNTPPPSQPAPPVSNQTSLGSAKPKRNRTPIIAGVVAGVAGFVLVAVAFVCVKTKVTNVNPWVTGLSGQLKKAFVTGVPKLKRSELETACEDFSNVIGSSSIGTLYKGTLSSGVEIAVACVAATSAKEWSETLELQFLKKIDTLSKVNHKNFVNLIGYCQEVEPFTRMMVFEYAPSGTLFEHLHIQEAEPLDWCMRLRVAMGMAYCLDYMHQLEIPEAHHNLSSSAIRLTEDYAAKIAEFTFWSEIAAVAPRESSFGKRLQKNNQTTSPECNVYNFGVILFEMVTGRVPYSVDNGSLENWASDYLIGDRPLKEMVDPTLSSYEEDQLEEIGKVIKACVHPDPRRRPEMREVCIGLREVTGITPDGAAPRISPMWWAELELMSDTM